MPVYARRQGQDQSVVAEYIIRMLGLDMCADTPVGNHIVRGISGGQKKRVTSGEMLVSAKRVRSPARGDDRVGRCSDGLDRGLTYSLVDHITWHLAARPVTGAVPG